MSTATAPLTTRRQATYAPSDADLSTPWFFEHYTYSSGEWCVVELSGEIDAASAAQVGAALDAALSGPGLSHTALLGPGRPKLIVDLTRTQFLDSSGFRPIAKAGARAKALGGLVRLVCPAGVLRDYLKIMNAVAALPVVQDLYSAGALG